MKLVDLDTEHLGIPVSFDIFYRFVSLWDSVYILFTSFSNLFFLYIYIYI